MQGDQFLDIADLFLNILKRNAGLRRFLGAFAGQGVRLLVDAGRHGRRLAFLADPFLQELDRLFTHSCVPRIF